MHHDERQNKVVLKPRRSQKRKTSSKKKKKHQQQQLQFQQQQRRRPARGFDYHDNFGYEVYSDETDHNFDELTYRRPAAAAAAAAGSEPTPPRRAGSSNGSRDAAAMGKEDDNNGRGGGSSGPIQKSRHCTDIICLLFFMVSVLAMCGLIAYSYLHGDLHRLTHFYTTQGCDTCGVINPTKSNIPFSGKDLTEFPYGLVTLSRRRNSNQLEQVLIGSTSKISNLVLNSGQFTTSDCVKACPNTTKPVLYRCIPLLSDEPTINGVVFSALQIMPEPQQLGLGQFGNGSTAAAALNNNETDIFKIARKFFNDLQLDVQNSWKDMAYLCLIGLGISVLMTVFLRLFAGLLIWFLLISVSLLLIIGSIVLWIFWYRTKTSFDDKSSAAAAAAVGGNANANANDDWSSTQIYGILSGAIATTVITVIVLLVILVMRKRIALLTELFNVAGKAIHSMPFMLLQPFITFIALAAVISLYILAALLIESAGIPTLKSVEVSSYDIKEFCYLEKNWVIIAGRWWALFMLFWMTQFVLGCQEFVLGGAVSVWFFTRKKSILHSPILISWIRLTRFHLGSVAFGSLTIAIVKFIRFLLTLLQNLLKSGSSIRIIGPICQGILCCLKCWFWLLEKVLVFLSRNAYIEMAIYGSGFCKSSRRAFEVIVDNALRLLAINSVGDWMLILAKLGIVAATELIGYYYLKDDTSIKYIWVPLVLVGICTYFIAHCFMGVYQMAIDSTFICFCEDIKLNDGVDKPYFMSKGLMEFVKKNQEQQRRTSSS